MKLILILSAALLAGCATTKGLELTEADARECAEVGCTAWSERQLERVARHFFALGVKAGIERRKGSSL